MKTQALLLLLLFLCPSMLFAQDRNEFKRLNLRGPVKSVSTYWRIPETVNGKETVREQIESTVVFDRFGRTVESLSYPYEGSLPSKTIFFYDRNGHFVLQESLGSIRRDRNTYKQYYGERYEYKYDASGLVIEQAKYSLLKQPHSLIALKYDSHGNVIEKATSEPVVSDKVHRTVYSYDDQNRLISSTSFTDGVKSSATTYNLDGAPIETILADGIAKITYTYDPQNRLIKSAGGGTREEIFYDDTKKTREERQYLGETAYTKTMYKLDQYGNVLERTETYSDDAKKQLAEIARRPSEGLIPIEAGAIAALSGMFARDAFKYEYDARGNWVKRVEYQATEFVIGQDNLDAELKPVRTQIRQIEYHNLIN